MKKYITTPIYYVNDIPHIGHAYTTIIADFLKKFYEIGGNEAFLLTGTDEHGQKIENSAKAKNKGELQYATEISNYFRSLWDDMQIDYDHFIRTTDKSHIQGVQDAFLQMEQNGDIYKGEYEGKYCISCESFFTDTQIIDDKFCPDCGKEVKTLKEESYFFRLSKYQDQLLKWYKSNPILPLYRQNEVVKFVENGLNDLCITRSTFKWGIQVPNDPKHIIYVWLDALLNYITALGYKGDEFSKNSELWSGATHIVGKDILRFHAIYFPAFLLSLKIDLPKHIYAHGWWLNDGSKMSKSVGNVINPREITKEYGTDAFRYFLLREIPFGQDGNFSEDLLIARINSDLANDLGNLLNRVIGMSEKYFDLKLESQNDSKYEWDSEFKNKTDKSAFVENMQIDKYINEIWKDIKHLNFLIAKYEPWTMMKENKSVQTKSFLLSLVNALTKITYEIYPIMPETSKKILNALGIESSTPTKEILVERQSVELVKIPPLFPRIEPKEDNKEEKVEVKSTKENKECDQIKIDDFLKLDIRVGEILEAKKIEGSEKLLCLKVDLGEDSPRQIVSGISQYFEPDELIHTQVCVLSNLKSTKLMGILSEGMILAGKDENGLKLITPNKKLKNGSKIS